MLCLLPNDIINTIFSYNIDIVFFKLCKQSYNIREQLLIAQRLKYNNMLMLVIMISYYYYIPLNIMLMNIIKNIFYSLRHLII